MFFIYLDCSLIGLRYADLFFMQGFYKAAEYAIKLRTEFTVLNQLRSTLPGQSGHDPNYVDAHPSSRGRKMSMVQQSAQQHSTQDSDVERVGTGRGARDIGGIWVQKEVEGTTTNSNENHNKVQM